MSSITMHGKSSLFLSRHGKSSRASLSEFFNFQPNSSSKSLQQPNLLRPSPHLQQGDPSGSGLSISVRPNRQTTRARSSGRRKRIDLGGPNRLRRTDPSVPLVLPLTYPVHPASGAKPISTAPNLCPLSPPPPSGGTVVYAFGCHWRQQFDVPW
jgi:hypothetical protein